MKIFDFYPLIKANVKNFVSKINIVYFSEVGLVTRRINRLLNYLLHNRSIHRNKDYSKTFLSLHSSTLSSLDLNSKVCELEAFGFCRIRASEYPVLSNPISDLKDFLLGLASTESRDYSQIQQDRKSYGKKYWLDLYKAVVDYNQSDDPVLQFIRHPVDTWIASKYLRQLPLLTELSFYYSPPNPEIKSSLTGSQNWHLDNDKPFQLKLFYSPYIVDDSQGPTTFLPCCLTTNANYPNYPGYFTDCQALNAGFPLHNAIKLTSSPNEFYLVDTSRCYHFGSRTSSSPRYLLIAGLGPYASYLNPIKMMRIFAQSYGFPLFNQQLRYTTFDSYRSIHPN